MQIDNSRANFLKESITYSVRESHRLGDLSEIYLSLMRFNIDVQNRSTGFATVESTSVPVNLDIQCIDHNGTSWIFKYNGSKIMANNFSLSDTPDELVASTTTYLNKCPGFIIEEESIKSVPPIPPNSTLTLEFGPQFLPRFSPDILSWVLVYIFNLIVISGLLPLFREVMKFMRKGTDYFN